jgi:AcrR family transcriptional regulator
VPKLADHDARRAEIADAVLRIAGRTGLHSVTMRSVAAEAGVSVRLVQYYFETKELLLQFTLTRLARRMGERIQARLARAGRTPRPRDTVAAVLTEALPTDEESRTFHLVYTAYAVLAVTDEKLAAQPFIDAPNTMEDFLVAQLEAAQRTGDIAADLDARTEAISLLALSAGLGTSVLLGQRSTKDALRILKYHLNRLTPKP